MLIAAGDEGFAVLRNQQLQRIEMDSLVNSDGNLYVCENGDELIVSKELQMIFTVILLHQGNRPCEE
jgi:hypothetical protein